jgi:hypothetical protein
MLAKFTLYCFIAVMIPGAFLLWAVGAITDLPELAIVGLGANLVEASVFVVVAYVTGLAHARRTLVLRSWASANPRSAKTFPELGVTIGSFSLVGITLLVFLAGLPSSSITGAGSASFLGAQALLNFLAG